MGDQAKTINKIQSYIKNYIEQTKLRGQMYGEVSEIESSWHVLDHINFIISGTEESEHSWSMAAFLREKGHGAKSLATVVEESVETNKYKKMSELRNEYENWRKQFGIE
jgi:hypothetical protein